jgi:DNA (cytosine-5)-methyltransferase 1
MDTVKFIDLFAGIGGLRMGFEKAFNALGIKTKCVLTSEIKPHAIKVLEDNYEHEKFVGDITKIKNDEIPEFDFLLAGFPCQAFSSAGKRLGFSDTRGTLFFEVERILRDKRPYGFILENVEGLIKHDPDPNDKNAQIGRTLTIILNSLKNLGYKVTWELLDSKYFGVPQSRKRVFIVGTLDKEISLSNFEVRYAKLKEILEQGLPTHKSKFTDCLLSHYNVKELYGKSIKDKRGGKNNIHSWDIGLKGEVTYEQKQLLGLLLKERRKKQWAARKGIAWMDGMPLTLEEISTFYQHKNLKEMLDDLVEKGYLKYEHPKDLVDVMMEDGRITKERRPRVDLPKGYNIVTGKLSFEFTKILDPEDIAPTIVATDVSKIGVVDGAGIRQLTVREGARLFGFPDNFQFNLDRKDQVFDLLGNTVVVPVVKAVAERLARAYLGIDQCLGSEKQEEFFRSEMLTYNAVSV